MFMKAKGRRKFPCRFCLYFSTDVRKRCRARHGLRRDRHTLDAPSSAKVQGLLPWRARASESELPHRRKSCHSESLEIVSLTSTCRWSRLLQELPARRIPCQVAGFTNLLTKSNILSTLFAGPQKVAAS